MRGVTLARSPFGSHRGPFCFKSTTLLTIYFRIGVKVSPLSFLRRWGRSVGIAALLPFLSVGCVPATLADRLPEFDAKARADLSIPDSAPQPRVVIVDEARKATLAREIVGILDITGGGLYDPSAQTIYLDPNKATEGSLYHELTHHYYRYMSDAQRNECLARLYEFFVTRGSFGGCPR